MCRVRQDDDLLDGFQPVAQLLDERNEGEIDEKQPVLRVIHDPGDLIGEEARIYRVINAAHSKQPVPDFKVPPVVPGERRGAFPHAEAA